MHLLSRGMIYKDVLKQGIPDLNCLFVEGFDHGLHFNSCIVHIIWGIQRFDIVLLFLTSRRIHVLRVFLSYSYLMIL